MQNILSNCKVLVTGGAGFIGSNLIEILLKGDNFVVCLDNLSTGKKSNLKDFLHNKNFKFIEGDIRDRSTCLDACVDIDYVFHEAALGSVPRSIKDPITTTEVNITGFVNMIFAAKERKVKRFIYASSSSIYGDDKTLPKQEDKLGTPLSPYAITKLTNELYAHNFAKIYNIDCIGLRYFNVFGRRQDPEGAYAAVIPKFADALLNEKAPTIYGDGSNSRDFTYIDNVIFANLLAARTDNHEALNQCYNIACGDRVTLNELFSAIKNFISPTIPKVKNIVPLYSAPRSGDIPHSHANINKAKKLLLYFPKYDFMSGLKETIEYYKKN